MVQRKVSNKLGIKTHLLKSDAQPPSPQTHEKLNNMIMKKPRPIKNPDESPFKKKKTQQFLHKDKPRATPNYMKSTSSFDARKEQTPKTASPSKTNGSASGNKRSRTSSLKTVRTLTKTPSFKPLRPSKKVILCDDLDAQRATCSSTLKDSKFPDYLQLSPGGTEVEGTSAMKVCPYTYCSLNGHHHAPVPPLKCFLSARRRALNLKTNKSFKLGCLSARQTNPSVKKNEEIVKIDMKGTQEMEEEESKDFFIEIYSEQEDKGGEDLECSDGIFWEEGYCSASCNEDVREENIPKAGVESLYGEPQELYDEESVSSGAWSDEYGDSESDSSNQQMKINHQIKEQEASTITEADVIDKTEEHEGVDLPIADQNINCQQEETSEESKSVPDFEKKSKDGTDENRTTTIIYNIIQFNISVYVNGEKTEHSVKVPMNCDKMETQEVKEAMEEESMSNEDDEAREVIETVADELDDQDIVSKEQLNSSYLIEKQDESTQECEACSQSYSMDEITQETDIKPSKKSDSSEELPDPCRGLTRGKKHEQEMHDDSQKFNPRGPNFLPEISDPDAETVDLRHQMMDERKNAEEWMVDFALQQAVTKLTPARKRKVALLVEAFEKVMPIPKYETHNRPISKAFTNARPMQACS